MTLADAEKEEEDWLSADRAPFTTEAVAAVDADSEVQEAQAKPADQVWLKILDYSLQLVCFASSLSCLK